jgi:putative serine protease PepD
MKQLATMTAALVVAALGGGLIGGAIVALVRDDDSEPTAAAVPASNTSFAPSVSALYKRVAPSVVEITVTAGDESSDVIPEPFGPPEGQQPQGTGTGWVYDSEGHIVTNHHVVAGAETVEVRFADGTEATARVVATDSSTDVALLELEEEQDKAAPLTRGSTESLEIGDPVVAIGSPFGLEGTLTTGVVSGLDRKLTAPDGFTIDDGVQTDAALNPGNSGGPLLDGRGRVVGMNSQIATESGGNDGIGYAVPIETVESVVSQLLADGQVEHAYLGVRVSDADGGARLEEVVRGGPADDAGLEAGDVVTKIGGKDVNNADDLSAAVNAQVPGDEVKVEVRRDGETETITVELGERPSSAE